MKTLPLVISLSLTEAAKAAQAANQPANQAVLAAQTTADQSAAILKDAQAALDVIEKAHEQNLHKVFAARCEYLSDLLEQLADQDPAYRLGSLIGDTPFIINLNRERLTFGITVKATGEEINTFENVEQYLLNLLK